MPNSIAPLPPTNRLTQTIEALANTLPPAWQTVLTQPAAAQALQQVGRYVERAQHSGAIIYPADPFRALRGMAPADVRVVIIGQDPYHGPGQAQGLAFSVPDDCRRPPSLRNIFKELARSYPDRPAATGNDLQCWADQGVLLLNTCLTVEQGQAGAHARQGWETVTNALLAHVAATGPKVFMLWGAHAQAKRALLPAKARHLVLEANHPSPLSANRPPTPFLGCGHFEQANAWLSHNGKTPVDWLPKPLQARLR
jgi:uracil-DNA glycosylase